MEQQEGKQDKAAGDASPPSLARTPSKEALNGPLSRAQLDELKQTTISTADKFYKHKQFQQGLDCLLEAYKTLSQETEILWRLCRAYFDLSELQPKENRKKYLEVGFQFAEKGLAIDQNSAVLHKWWAIFCSLLGDYQAAKEKIGNAFKIKEHALKANELAPGDPTTLHLLGRWCFSVAGIGWIERTAAAALFGTPPSSTYEEALTYFTKAAQIDEKFTRNLIFIGDCHVNLKKYADAKTWYRKAADVPFDQNIKSEVGYHEEAEAKFLKYKGY